MDYDLLSNPISPHSTVFYLTFAGRKLDTLHRECRQENVCGPRTYVRAMEDFVVYPKTGIPEHLDRSWSVVQQGLVRVLSEGGVLTMTNVRQICAGHRSDANATQTQSIYSNLRVSPRADTTETGLPFPSVNAGHVFSVGLSDLAW